MTKEDIHGAIEANVPFTITMADGEKHLVSHRDFIGLRGDTRQ